MTKTTEVIDEDTGKITELHIETLAGDLRDAMLMRIRAINMPWSMMTQEKQSDLANGLDLAARDLVRGAVRLLTDFDFPRAVVTLGDVKIIGGDKARIEGKITAPNIFDYRELLGEHVGDTVMILMVDSEAFMAARAPVKTDPDQPELGDMAKAS